MRVSIAQLAALSLPGVLIALAPQSTGGPHVGGPQDAASVPVMRAPAHETEPLSSGELSPEEARLWTARLVYPLFDFQLRGATFDLRDLEGRRRKSPATRLAELRARLGEDPTNFEDRLELATTLREIGALDEARETFELILQEARPEGAPVPTAAEGLRFGRTLRRYAQAFRDPQAIVRAEELLAALSSNAEIAAAARLELAELYLWIAMDEARRGAELDRCRTIIERCRNTIAGAAQDPVVGFRARALDALAHWSSTLLDPSNSPDERLAETLDVAAALNATAEIAPIPKLVRGLAAALAITSVVERCGFAPGPHGACHAALDESLRARVSDFAKELDLLFEFDAFNDWARELTWIEAHLRAAPEALEHFETGLDNMRNPAPLLEAAVVFQTLAGHTEAVERALERLTRVRDNARTSELRGRTCARRGDHMGALDAYSRAMGLEPNLRSARTGAAIARLKLSGEDAQAVEWLEEVLDKGPDAEAEFALGISLFLRGERERAREVLERAYRLAAPGWRAQVSAAIAAL